MPHNLNVHYTVYTWYTIQCVNEICVPTSMRFIEWSWSARVILGLQEKRH